MSDNLDAERAMGCKIEHKHAGGIPYTTIQYPERPSMLTVEDLRMDRLIQIASDDGTASMTYTVRGWFRLKSGDVLVYLAYDHGLFCVVHTTLAELNRYKAKAI